ncbi:MULTISPECIES: PspA/IM30 family protein [unclassified Nocardia]|uniref:PspA/IM30 family protein n=1 Tax=unclassified Nocardia TaxID=2637762 RepID=UPI001CE3D589|nr:MULTISPECIES: hypothetical protein [unclassified Nocardia]
MSDTSEITSQLAALPDAELAAVLFTVTSGRPAFWAVRAALSELAGVGGHVHTGEYVTPDTSKPPGVAPEPNPSASGQVGGVVPVVGVPTSEALGGYSAGGVPTFESVRDKVERRFGTAQGMGELDRQTPVGRSADEQWQAREQAARERLEQIRKSVHGKDIGATEP